MSLSDNSGQPSISACDGLSADDPEADIAERNSCATIRALYSAASKSAIASNFAFFVFANTASPKNGVPASFAITTGLRAYRPRFPIRSSMASPFWQEFLRAAPHKRLRNGYWFIDLACCSCPSTYGELTRFASSGPAVCFSESGHDTMISPFDSGSAAAWTGLFLVYRLTKLRRGTHFRNAKPK